MEEKKNPGVHLRDAVAQIWAEVLTRENIRPNDNFFDLGGDSLKALEVISRLHALFGVELPLIVFFEDPTIDHLSEVLEELRPATQVPVNVAGAPGKNTATSAVTQVWCEVLQREGIGL